MQTGKWTPVLQRNIAGFVISSIFLPFYFCYQAIISPFHSNSRNLSQYYLFATNAQMVP